MLQTANKITHNFSGKSQGFTMIELVMVIVIVGILAAAALPRYLNLNDQAQVASIKAFSSQMQSMLNLSHAAWIAMGAPTSGSPYISILIDSGATLRLNSNGWRDTSTGFIPTASQCGSMISNTLVNPPQLVTSSGSCTTENCYITTVTAGAQGNSKCVYTLSGTSHAITYDTYTGEVTTQ